MKLRDIVKITMDGKARVLCDGLHDVYMMYLKNGEHIKVISDVPYHDTIIDYKRYNPIVNYREIDTYKLIFTSRYIEKNRNHKRISKMLSRASRYYFHHGNNGFYKIYNSKDEIINNIIG